MIKCNLSKDPNGRVTRLRFPVRALRLTRASFADDGPERAIQVLAVIGDDLNEKDKKTLGSFPMETRAGNEFLEELKELRRLIEQLPRPTFSVNKPRREVIELIGEVDCCLKKKNGKNGKQDRARILADFLNEQADPWALRDAISEWRCLCIYASAIGGNGHQGGKTRPKGASCL